MRLRCDSCWVCHTRVVSRLPLYVWDPLGLTDHGSWPGRTSYSEKVSPTLPRVPVPAPRPAPCPASTRRQFPRSTRRPHPIPRAGVPSPTSQSPEHRDSCLDERSRGLRLPRDWTGPSSVLVVSVSPGAALAPFVDGGSSRSPRTGSRVSCWTRSRPVLRVPFGGVGRSRWDVRSPAAPGAWTSGVGVRSPVRTRPRDRPPQELLAPPVSGWETPVGLDPQGWG